MIQQCPRCELRFRDAAEMRSHLVDDHGVDPETVERHYRLSPGVHPHRRPSDPTHIVHSDPHRDDR